MYMAPAKAPSTTRVGMWSDGLTYGLLAAFVLGSTAIIVNFQQGDGLRDMAAALFLLALIALGLTIHACKSTVVYAHGLKRFVKHTIGHDTSNLYRVVPVARLLGSQGGWTDISCVGVHKGRYCIDGTIELQNCPFGSSPVLVVRDDFDSLHLFRFGRRAAAAAEIKSRDNHSSQLIDHGVIGPNRFDRDMFPQKQGQSQTRPLNKR